MAKRDIFHMHEIEAGIDKGRHTARCRLHNDAAGRRRANVTRADGGGGIDDDGRQTAFGHHFLDQPFGQKLAQLVGANRGLFVVAGGFIGGTAIERLQCGNA